MCTPIKCKFDLFRMKACHFILSHHTCGNFDPDCMKQKPAATWFFLQQLRLKRAVCSITSPVLLHSLLNQVTNTENEKDKNKPKEKPQTWQICGKNCNKLRYGSVVAQWQYETDESKKHRDGQAVVDWMADAVILVSSLHTAWAFWRAVQ